MPVAKLWFITLTLKVSMQLYKIGWISVIPIPHQTKPNQTKPNQTKPNQTKPNQTKPNQTKPNQTVLTPQNQNSLSCDMGGPSD
ncbi:hypothetical protein QBC46DRAFT_121914 [Diplogelasinospora grovesii]|uniref:Uncharacterized protein n=1 Tax=Diplogelasinospora grovesii TaxID=303347 RepID=A0AAN6S5J2_9PEZI|nr:hypothetical protein QBC46DRAFT_121914 [Diplogelasinospora grovesii]